MQLNWLDLAIIVVYLIGVTLFGLRFRRKQRSLRDYFLADNNIPWWALALSIVAAETSTLTIISVPGIAFDSNLTFLQVVFGYMVGRVLISFVLLPHYFRGKMFTAYELMGRRFGPRLRTISAGIFLLTRAAAEGVRVYAISIVVGIAFGTGQVASIAIITLLTLIYTFEGGLAAVIWTDVVQLAIYVGGTFVGLAVLTQHIPGGIPAVHELASQAGKLRVFDFSTDLWKPYTIWAGVIGGTFLTTASHGIDQLIVQRLLAAKNQRQAQVALLSSGLAILLQFTLFLFVGIFLWAFYQGLRPTPKSDAIFPHFVVTEMPHGVAGLLIAAILAAAMSNLSAALNSLSSSSVMDFYLRWRPERVADGMRISRIATVLWALVLALLAMLAMRSVGIVLEFGLRIASITYGALLGVFLLGVLTNRANESGAIVGMVVGFVSIIVVAWWNLAPWTWFVAIGALITFAVGYAGSLMFTPEIHTGEV